jgi:hypothetical protein
MTEECSIKGCGEDAWRHCSHGCCIKHCRQKAGHYIGNQDMKKSLLQDKKQ